MVQAQYTTINIELLLIEAKRDYSIASAVLDC